MSAVWHGVVVKRICLKYLVSADDIITARMTCRKSLGDVEITR